MKDLDAQMNMSQTLPIVGLHLREQNQIIDKEAGIQGAQHGYILNQTQMVPKSNPLPKIDQVIHQSYKSEVDIDKKDQAEYK